MKNVPARLTKVGILSRVINGVVVVPEETTRLRVGIVVVLELARGRDVLSPAIPGRALSLLA